MNKILITAFFLCSLSAHASSDTCEIGLGLGYTKVPVTKFKIKAFEQKLLSTPQIPFSRNVDSSSSAQEFSIGCFVTDNIFLEFKTMRGSEFYITNNISITPMMLGLVKGYDLSGSSGSAILVRKVAVNSNGIFGYYRLHLNAWLEGRFGGGVYQASVDKTSWVSAIDSDGHRWLLDNPPEKIKGYLPLLTLGLLAKMNQNTSFLLQGNVPFQGVKILEVQLKYSF